jgi:hypothetical protein
MKKILLLITFLSVGLYTAAHTEEVECKAYNVACKVSKGMKNFAADTKEFQKKEWSKAAEAQKKTRSSKPKKEKSKKDKKPIW